MRHAHRASRGVERGLIDQLRPLLHGLLTSVLVSGVAGVVACGGVLLVARVMGELAVEGSLDEHPGKLLEQPSLAEQVVGLLVVFEQFAEQFASSRRRNLILFRLKVDYRHLHGI